MTPVTADKTVEAAAPAEQPRRRVFPMSGRAVKRIIVGGALVLVALGAWVAWHVSDVPRALVAMAVEYLWGPALPPGFASGNGRVEAREYDIATKRATRIVKVLADEGDLVQPGQVVVRMYTEDLDADLRASEAQLTEARENKRRALAAVVQQANELESALAAVTQRESDLRRADAAIAQRESEVKRATAAIANRESEVRRTDAGIVQRQSELVLAEQDVERAVPLLAPGAINRQEYDQYVSRQTAAEAVLKQAQAAKQAADAALIEAQAQLGTANSALTEARAQRDAAVAAVAQAKAHAQAAEAQLQAARVDVDYREAAIHTAAARIERVTTDITDSTLTSPVLGRVQVKVSDPGEVLSAGGRVLNVIDLTDVYMTFFLPTATAGRVALGAEVRLVLDAVPDLVIPARVTYVSDVAQFTPKTVETKVERDKLMFRIKAHIPAELLKQHLKRVKTGLPGVAYVRLDPDAKWPDRLAVRLPR
jgi:HlyD family secretion protein